MTNPEPKTVTLEQINAEIASEHCFTAADGVCGVAEREAGYVQNWASAAHDTSLGLLTFCVLVLRNGFTVTGQSAYADPAKFNAEMGRKLAREDAIRQCWKLLGFRLRDQIAAEAAAPAAKHYTVADIVDLKWVTAAPHEDPYGDQFNVFAKLKDGKEIRASFRLYGHGDPSPVQPRLLAVNHALRAANGEA